MKRTSLFAATLALSGMFIFSSCDKIEEGIKEETKEESIDEESFKEDATITLETSDYEKEEIDLEKEEGCKHYTKGMIKYTKDGKDLGTFDFGKGEKDSKGTFSWKDKKEEIDLEKKKDGHKHNFDKKVIVPIVKTEDCDYPVEGTVEYYKNGEWVATTDFGNGTCDDIATKKWAAGSHGEKTWEAGTKEFSLSEAKKKYHGKGKGKKGKK